MTTDARRLAGAALAAALRDARATTLSRVLDVDDDADAEATQVVKMQVDEGVNR